MTHGAAMPSESTWSRVLWKLYRMGRKVNQMIEAAIADERLMMPVGMSLMITCKMSPDRIRRVRERTIAGLAVESGQSENEIRLISRLALAIDQITSVVGEAGMSTVMSSAGRMGIQDIIRLARRGTPKIHARVEQLQSRIHEGS